MGARAQRQTPCRVSCVLPGLVWSAPFGEALPPLPGLAALLGHGRVKHLPGEPHAAWLSRQFGAENLSWGALRWAGEGEPPLPGCHTLCADPVSLGFRREPLLLHGPKTLALQPEETAALVEALNAEFSALGRFQAAGPERIYLHCTDPVEARFAPVFEAIGRPLGLFEPEGPDAARWTRLANEIQILLHHHPLNRTREARGQPRVNALWFWGETVVGQPDAPADTLIGDEPLLRGLAAASGARWLSSVEAGSPSRGLAGHTWRWDGSLHDAALAGDFSCWLAALRAIDAELLQPLWQAWRSGHLRELALLAPADGRFLETRLGLAQRLAFWKRPLSKAALQAALQPPIQKDQP